MSKNDICILSNRLSSKIAYSIHNVNNEISYQDCFDYELAIQNLANQFQKFIIIANFANNNELKDTQQFCIEHKIYLFIISYEKFNYTILQSPYIIPLVCNTYQKQQNMFKILNKKIKDLTSNE